MGERKADFATVTDGNDAIPATRAGAGRAAIIAAVASALVMVGLVEAWLGARPSLPLLQLALATVPGITAGLFGNVRGSAGGAAVGVAAGGLWVIFRLAHSVGNSATDLFTAGHFFGGFLLWMSGGALPEMIDQWEIDRSYDQLRSEFWTMIAFLIFTNVTLALGTALVVRHVHRRLSTPPSAAKD